MWRRPLAMAAAALLATAATACADNASDAADSTRLEVVAGFYPLQFVAEQVGGDHVSVTNLAQPGAEPHDLELSPRQVAAIADADLVIYLEGFQPAVDATVAQQAAAVAFDVATTVPLLAATDDGHGHGEDEDGEEGHEEDEDDHEELGTDPHLWLDPDRLATVADAVADRLGALAPEHAADFTTAAADLRQRLADLDTEYAEGLANCARREIVVSHAAFGYLADRYQLEQIAISGLSPEEEPTPGRMAEVIDEAREHAATTIFFETLVSPRVAERIATEVGAQTAVLDPIEGLTPGSTGDYLSVMRENLAVLRPALGCE